MKKVLFAIAAVVAVFFASCTDNSPYPGFEKVGNSSYFLVHRPGKGTELADTGGVLFMKIKFKTTKDSVFLNINETTRKESYPMLVSKPKFAGDFLDFFARLHVGDSATFFVNLDTLHKYYEGEFNLEPQYDTMQYLGFLVEVDSIMSRAKLKDLQAKMEKEQNERMAKMEKVQAVMEPIQKAAREKEPELKKKNNSLLKSFLAQNKITSKPDDKGIYYQEISSGAGNPLMPGNFVSLRYVGKYLDGTIFDCNTLIPEQELLSFPLGQNQMIPGFEASVMKMKKGGKAIFILPSDQAYRDSLSRAFEVEVVDVKDAPPAGAMRR